MKKNPRSEGEELIEDFLFNADIKFEVEKKIENLSGDTKAFRLADFYLPKYQVYLEFLGKWNEIEKRAGYNEKKEVYRKNGIPCIYIYPDNLGPIDWFFKNRLRTVLLQFNKTGILWKYEIRRYLKEFSTLLLTLIVIAYISKNLWIQLGIGLLITSVLLSHYLSLKAHHKKLLERAKLKHD